MDHQTIVKKLKAFGYNLSEVEEKELIKSLQEAEAQETTGRACILTEVVAGLIPNKPMPELTKRFAITSDEFHKEGKYKDKPGVAEMQVMKTYGLTQEYMRTLWTPSRVNWVQCSWLYL